MTPSSHGADPVSAEARLLDADRRVGDAERAMAALRRRAEAAEVRVGEARDRVLQERDLREESLAEVTALLDAERRRGTELAETLQDQLIDVRARLSEAENSLRAERDERSGADDAFMSAAHGRLATALDERDGIERQLSSELAERVEDVRTLSRHLADAHAAADALRNELSGAEVRVEAARSEHAALKDGHAELGRALETERAAVREATERVEAATRAAREQAERSTAAVAEIEYRLAAELQEREQLLQTVRDAEHRADQTGKVEAQLELRARELTSLRAEARGAGDAVAKLQADLAVLQQRLGQGQEELRTERVARRDAETILEKARQDHRTALDTADAALEHARAEHETELQRSRDAHETELKRSEGEADAAVAAERSVFDRERSDLEARVQRAVAETEATMEGERIARQRERNETATSLASLRTDIESAISALREKLEGEISRGETLTGTLEERTETLTEENRALAEARERIAQALRSSEARATTLEEELTHRRDLMEQVGTATDELRSRLETTRAALSDETALRQSTELAARDVIAAAQNVLTARGDGEAPAPKLSDILPGPIPAPFGSTRPPVPTRPTCVPEDADLPPEGVDELSERFDRIRAELAERGIRSARAPEPPRPGDRS